MAAHERERLWPYASGALRGPDRAAVDEHLLLCPECRAELERVRLAQSVLPAPSPLSARVPPLSDATWSRIDARVSAAAERELLSRSWFGWVPQWLRVPALVGATAAAARVEGRSFEISAGDVELRVVGTRFLVERSEAQVLVAVSEGTVELAAHERLVSVPAGHSVVVDATGVHEQPIADDDRKTLAVL